MLARTRWALLTAGSLVAAWAAYACASNPSGACDENGTCPGADGGGDAPLADAEPGEGGEVGDGGVDATADAGDGGADGDGSAGDAGDGAVADESVCDPTRTPAEDPCVIDELYGVFVSPAGVDTNLGTRASPVKTITRAMVLAHGHMQRVYACAGTYAENLVVSASNNAASVYGGLDCTSWTYDPTHDKVRIAPAQVGYALQVTGTSSGTVTALFEDVELDAPAASSSAPTQPNSVGVFAYLAQLMLQRVVVVAGPALSGTAGASGGSAGDPSNLLAPALLDGNPPAAMGAPSKLCTCPDDATTPGVISSVGGQGSAVAVDAGPGLPSYGGDAGAGNPGPNGVSCGTGGTAQNGADGPTLPAGISSLSRGTLSAAGWVPSAGAAGSNGQAGQGGGGGGNGQLNTGMGSGGACGGCGGAGGMPGTGGGSSIAILSLDSMVSLVGCTLTADNAGSGGSGGNGEPGQAGGSTGLGSGVGVMAGCPGGAGGTGAGGNGGQGGPGGLSLGIGYSGASPPTFDGVPVAPVTATAGVQVGNAGAGGAGGTGGPSAMSNLGHPGTAGARGIDGVAQAISSF